MSSEVVIRARGLGKAYAIYERPSDRLREIVSRGRWAHAQRFWAVRGVDLEVRRGETVGLVGRNGSGKSTLLEMISGTLEPSEGSVEVSGRVAALLELGAGFNDDFTGRENVRLNGAILGLSPRELDLRFDEIVAFADIGPFLDQPVKTYSSGMFARLAFAVAIHATPDILVVDEILSVGDEAFQRKCFAKIEDIKRRGGSILFVSHTAATVIELCDRAMLLDGGRALLTGSPQTVVALYQRLAYAPSSQADAVRDLIEDEARHPGRYEANLTGSAADAERGPQPEVHSDPEATEESDAQPEDPAWLDPHLVSQSVLRYEPNGALIRDPMLLAASGEQVNSLAPGRVYRFRYNVDFDKDAADVRYHTLVKTVTGLELGGGTHPAIGVLGFEAKAGLMMEVTFEFCCALNAGVYFLNCGVMGGAGDQLHRIVDAVAFRVMPESEATTFGHVHFDHKATVARTP